MKNVINQKLLNNFPAHKYILFETIKKLEIIKSIKSVCLFGSLISGYIDQFSDIDLLIITSNNDLRHCWDNRIKIEKSISKIIFHFDLDEIMPTSCAVIFSNNIKLHLTFVSETNLEVSTEYKDSILLFNTSKLVTIWHKKCCSLNHQQYYISELNHNDERFWFWYLQGISKLERGELWAAFDTLHTLRTIYVFTVDAFNRNRFQGFRKLETRWDEDSLKNLQLFISYVKKPGLVKSFKHIFEKYLNLRKKFEELRKIQWSTSDETIYHLIDSISFEYLREIRK